MSQCTYSVAIVYQHRRKDTNEIFYIGIGKDYYRMGKKSARNQYWHNIVNKHGYTKELLFKDISWEEAIKKEIELIKKYGRRDLKTGCLVNMTRGGEGCPSKEEGYVEPYSLSQLKSIIKYFHPCNK